MEDKSEKGENENEDFTVGRTGSSDGTHWKIATDSIPQD